MPLVRFTSRQASTLFPFLHAAPVSPRSGVLVGVDVSAGEAPFYYDQWTAYDEGELEDPNIAVLGSVGEGKSAMAKALLRRQVGVFGSARRFVMVVSPKANEYDRLASDLGLTVVKLGVDGQRINPMDIAGRGESQLLVRQQLARDLISKANNMGLTPLELSGLDAAIAELSAAGEPFTLRDIQLFLARPPQSFADRISRPFDQLVAELVNLRAGLDRLTNGPLANFFGGESTVTVDWQSSAGVVFDLSGVAGTDAFGLVLLSTVAWMREAWAIRRCAGGVAVQLLDESWELVTSTPGYFRRTLKLSRELGLSTILVSHRDSDWAASADSGSAASKTADQLLHDISTRIIFRSDPTVADRYRSLFGLTSRQASWLSQCVKGRCLWLTPGRCRVVQVLLSDNEKRLFDTDAGMRGF